MTFLYEAGCQHEMPPGKETHAILLNVQLQAPFQLITMGSLLKTE